MIKKRDTFQHNKTSKNSYIRKKTKNKVFLSIRRYIPKFDNIFLLIFNLIGIDRQKFGKPSHEYGKLYRALNFFIFF